MREKNRNSIEKCRKKLPQFTTMNVIDGQAGIIICSSLIFYSLTIDNILNIIVLLILSSVTITSLLGDDGIIKKAQEAVNKINEAIQNEQTETNALLEELNTIIIGNNGDGTDSGEDTGEEDNPPVVDTPKVENNLSTVISQTENTDLEDSYGNKITIPAGFFIVTPTQDATVEYDYSDNGLPVVQDGIVIQNQVDGNQFVWVPIGDIKNKDGSTTTIKLGRYSNFTMSGTTPPDPAQEATESSYNTAVLIEDYYFEISDSFTGDGTVNAASSYGNTKATNLQEWISTSLVNGGYYIARYEASQSTSDTAKAASIKGVSPWATIIQSDIATVAKATYAVDGANSSNYYSDLINSYAWDTAIIFIQAYEDSTYASANYGPSFTTTGTNSDKVCNIHDMSGNAWEWSTETSIGSLSNYSAPCTPRGGYGNSNNHTSFRYSLPLGVSRYDYSFRLTLCLK